MNTTSANCGIQVITQEGFCDIYLLCCETGSYDWLSTKQGIGDSNELTWQLKKTIWDYKDVNGRIIFNIDQSEICCGGRNLMKLYEG
jgi:hypothetical protein